jgi:ATP-binding cassette subfamily F protein 3
MIDNISKSFADQVLLSETGFQINPGERVGLVGRNGHGKTTLLNMITGRDHPDEGSISYPAGYTIGFLSQKIVFSCKSVIEEAMQGLADHEKDHYWKAEKILAGLGFSRDDFTRDPEEFSGGFQVRLNLAKVLVSHPDLLILDEPTNYLDIASIRWISGFLVSWQGELLLVTHDRSFMDNIVTHVAGIHRHKIKKIKGTTSKYYNQIAKDEEVYEKTRQNEEKRRKEMQVFISRFRAKARLANMVQSRIKTLEKTESKQKLQKLETLDFSFNYLPFSGKQVLNIEDLAFGWDKNNLLIDGFSMTVYPGDRIGIIGKNGRGKTSFLKLINGSILPLSGRIQMNPAVEYGYFEQTNVQSLNDEFTIEQELMNADPDCRRQAARNICGAMMFSGDAALKKISVLSGGEKSRVMLGKLLMKPLNLLLLDEPSNHLDMESCDAFVAALDNFRGAVMIVTHNEMFLHSLATRLIVFKNNRVEVFEGNYGQFLEKIGWDEDDTGRNEKKQVLRLSKKEIRQKKSEIVTLRSKQLKPLKIKIDSIETAIEKNESKIAGISQELVEASNIQDGTKISALAKKLAELEKNNELLFDDLEKYMDELERIENMFKHQIELFEKD